MKRKQKNKVESILNKERNVLFAYLYGSFLSCDAFRDIDIAVYLKQVSFRYLADLKIRLSKSLNMPSDFIDITVLNGILESEDAFSLLYLEKVLKDGALLVNHNIKLWSDFIEDYSNKFRAAEAILIEAQ
jgi:predicted nucleotidyltransferase